MSKKIKTNNKHRICRSTGCKHVLSRYNLENYCHVHRQITNARPESTASSSRR